MHRQRRDAVAPWVMLAVAGAAALAWRAMCLDLSQWFEGVQYRTYCYSDVLALWFSRDISVGAAPYLEMPFEYPPGMALQILALSRLTVSLGVGAGGFLVSNAFVNMAAAGVVLMVLQCQAVPIGRRLVWAVSPLTVAYLLLNWDVVAVALLVIALFAHQRGRNGWAGVAAGLGAAYKLFPVLVVPVIVLACLRRRAPRDAATHVATAVVTWLAFNLPVAVIAPEGWWRFFSFSAGRSVTAGSTWALLSHVLPFGVEAATAASGVLFVLGSAMIGLLGWRAHDPERMWVLVVPVIAWFLLTSKVYSPQFDLWLLAPLVWVGAARHIASFLIAGAAVFLCEFAFLGGTIGYAPLGWAVAVRMAVLGWVVVSTSTAGSAAPAQRQLPNQSSASSASSGRASPNHSGAK